MAKPKFVEVPSGTGGLHGNAAAKAKAGNYLEPGGKDKASLPVTATVDEMLGPQQRREDEAIRILGPADAY
jgi:hypothetical protein